jgi:hypothetical protein
MVPTPELQMALGIQVLPQEVEVVEEETVVGLHLTPVALVQVDK